MLLDISEDKYHADPCDVPSLSASISKIIVSKSPAHAWLAHPRLNPNFQTEENGRFDIGSAAHALLLEGENRMRPLDFDDWRTKASKEERDQARAEGLYPILRHQYEAVHTMAEAARKAIAECQEFGYRLEDCMTEKTIIWHEPDGTRCRMRADIITNDRKVIVDYKTCDNANPESFVRQIANMGYDLQGAFYKKGVAEEFGTDAKFLLLAQEIEPPYSCTFIGLPPAFLFLGAAKMRYAMATWAECMATGQWPGYGSRIHWVEPPAWALNRWLEERPESVEEIDWSNLVVGQA